MAILFTILKVLGGILLAVLLLLVLALVLPLGLDVSYRAGQWQVQARYAMLRFPLYPRRPKPEKKAAAAPKPSEPVNQPKTEPKPAPQSPPAKQPKAAAPAAAKAEKKTPPPASQPKPAQEKAAGGKEAKELPFGLSGRIRAVQALLHNDPAALVKCAFGHLGWLGQAFAGSIRISRVNVYWTVTAEDAAQTAQQYGALQAVLNQALALLQQAVRFQADRLWLEPDFTGEQLLRRQICFRVRSSAAALLWVVLRLLHRVWNDPLLQPKETV